MNQRDWADALDMSQEIIERLETGGQIQQREMDTLLRLFFKLAKVRAELGSLECTRPFPPSEASFPQTQSRK